MEAWEFIQKNLLAAEYSIWRIPVQAGTGYM